MNEQANRRSSVRGNGVVHRRKCLCNQQVLMRGLAGKAADFLLSREERRKNIQIPLAFLKMIKKMGLKDKGDKNFTRYSFDRLLFNVNWRYRGFWFERNATKSEILEEIPLSHGPVLDNNLILQVNSKVSLDSARKVRCGNRERIYYLSGLLVDNNGRRFHGEKGNGSGGIYYYYFNKANKLRINADEIESKIDQFIIKKIGSSHYLKKLIDRAYRKILNTIDSHLGELESINQLIMEIDSKVENQKMNLINSELTAQSINLISTCISQLHLEKDECLKKYKCIEQIVSRLKLENVSADLQERITKISQKYQNAKRDQKRLLLMEFFEKIVVEDKYRVKVILKEASNTEAFLFESLTIKAPLPFDDSIRLYSDFKRNMYSIGRLAKLYNCSRKTVKIRLKNFGIPTENPNKINHLLVRKILNLRSMGNSFEEIAKKLNSWKVPTRTNTGKWHPKTVREIVIGVKKIENPPLEMTPRVH